MGKKAARGLTLNRADTADLFGIAKTTLDDWVRRGCPVVQRGSRGKAWQFSSADVSRWREDDIRASALSVEATPAEELRRRKLEAETQLIELDLAKAKELVAPIEQMEKAMDAIFGEIRANLRNALPARAAQRLIGVTSETEIKTILRDEIDQALENLSEDELIEDEDLELEEIEEHA